MTRTAMKTLSLHDALPICDANPVLTGTVTGVKNGDAIGGSYSTSADKTSSVVGGANAIGDRSSGTPPALAEYRLVTKKRKLTVTTWPLSVKAENQEKLQGR